jgi:hypothetical protein
MTKKFAKILTDTDVGANGSHQSGPLIPISVQGVLPKPNPLYMPTATQFVKVDVFRNGKFIQTVNAKVVAHTRNYTRDTEIHLTGFMYLVDAKPGDIMVVCRRGRRFIVDIVPKRKATNIKSQLSGKRYGYV